MVPLSNGRESRYAIDGSRRDAAAPMTTLPIPREDVLPFLQRIRRMPRRRVHSIGRYGVFWDSRRRPGAAFNPLIFVLASPDSPASDVRWIGNLEDAVELISSGEDPDPAVSPVEVPERQPEDAPDLPGEILRLVRLCGPAGRPATERALRTALAAAVEEARSHL